MGAACEPATTVYELKFPAACWGIASLSAGNQAGIGLTMNDGDTGAGQGGQKGWSGWGPYSCVYGKNAEETGLVTLVLALLRSNGPLQYRILRLASECNASDTHLNWRD